MLSCSVSELMGCTLVMAKVAHQGLLQALNCTFVPPAHVLRSSSLSSSSQLSGFCSNAVSQAGCALSKLTGPSSSTTRFACRPVKPHERVLEQRWTDV